MRYVWVENNKVWLWSVHCDVKALIARPVERVGHKRVGVGATVLPTPPVPSPPLLTPAPPPLAQQ